MSNESRDAARGATPGQESGTRQFVTFVVGREVFAVDLSPVQEIIRVPEIVGVPLAPPSLEGLANLRGRILPIISLRRVFGFEERAYDDATRAVVIDLGQPLGFVVDKVASVVNVDQSRIETPALIESTVNVEFLSGLLKDVGGHKMIMVLDFGKLIAAHFTAVRAAARRQSAEDGAAGRRPADAAGDAAALDDEMQFVSFEVADQEYAIVIDHVQEIVQVPADIVQVPHSQQHVLGVMTLRNRLLPLVSLRRMFGLPHRELDDQSRIVVVCMGGASVGVVMDRVNEVLRVARAAVDRMPAQLAHDDNLSEIQEICRLDGGRRMVSILSVDRMFRHSSMKSAVTTVDEMKTATGGEGAAGAGRHDDEEQVVVFRLGKEEFGVPIDAVQEIVRPPEQMTSVPKAPPAVEGVINLRGAVLPVIDLRRRLGLAAAERSDRQRIIVLLIDGMRTGFIVDSVSEVLKVPRSAIEPAPMLTADANRVLARMANLEKQKRMVQLIDPEHLIDVEHRPGIAQLAAA